METTFATKKDEIIFRSKLPDITIPSHLPLHTYCFEKISEFRNRPCLINGWTDEVFTYEEVELTSRRVGSGLSKLGIQKGDTVMILLPNSPEFVFAFLGASYIGAKSTAANPHFTPHEVKKQARASSPKIIITEGCHVHKISEYALEIGIKIFCIDDGCLSFTDLTTSDESEMPEVKILPDEDVVALLYSSGTTGMPKGAMITHKNIVTNLAQLIDGENPSFYIHSGDVMLCVLPLFHIYSLNVVLLCAMRVGATILVMDKFDMIPFLQLLQKYKVTIVPLVPPIMLAIAKSPVVARYDLSSVRILISGAAPLGKDLEDAVKMKFPNAIIGQGYGLTEAAPVVSICSGFAKYPNDFKSGSCGTVVRNAELKIVDAENGASLGRNKPGEICIRSDQVFKGYLNDPESTMNTIDEEGWLHTGDIGMIDDNDELFIVDRLKELIKYKGFQVAPAEIEALLLNHPEISDAAVVPMKDEEAGEVPIAFVVPSSGSTITENEIRQFIAEQVIFYKRIKRVIFVDVIPKSPSGKILRKDLKARLGVAVPNHATSQQ